MPQYLTVAIYHGLSFSSRWTFQFGALGSLSPGAEDANSSAQKDRGGGSRWKPTPPSGRLDGQNNSARMKIHVLRRRYPPRRGPRKPVKFFGALVKPPDKWGISRYKGKDTLRLAITVHQISLIPRAMPIVGGTRGNKYQREILRVIYLSLHEEDKRHFYDKEEKSGNKYNKKTVLVRETVLRSFGVQFTRWISFQRLLSSRRPSEDYETLTLRTRRHKTTHGSWPPVRRSSPVFKKDHFTRRIGFQIVHK